MTRINCVPVTELSRQHLVAEYRELPRVFTLARAAWARGDEPVVHERYFLGEGHVKSFYCRLRWLRERWWHLHDEMVSRGYQANLPRSLGRDTVELPPEWQGHWQPNEADMEINRARIKERS